MVDALTPAVAALKQSIPENQSINKALELSTEAARQGMERTIPLVARKGRASYLGERSAGHQDPGATSSYLIVQRMSAHLSGDDLDRFLRFNPAARMLAEEPSPGAAPHEKGGPGSEDPGPHPDSG